MSEEEKKPTQSFSISNATLSDVQMGVQAGGNQINIFNKNETTKQITTKEAIELIKEIEQLIKDSDLPESQKQEAIQYLAFAKKDAQEKEPDKDFIAKNLQRSTKIIKAASNTLEAGKGLWEKVQPILGKLRIWLGVAIDYFN